MQNIKYNIITLSTLLLATFLYSQEKGKVGVGTTAPQRTMHVEGTARVTKLEDKTDDEKYDNVLLMKTKTPDKGDIHYVPRRVFSDYRSIDLTAVSRVVTYNDIGQNPIDNYTRDKMREDSYMEFENTEFRIELLDNDSKYGKFQFQYRPTLYNVASEDIPYGIENRAVVFHTGATNVGIPSSEQRTGQVYYLSQDVSSIYPWRNLQRGIGNSHAIDSPISEFMLFNFGSPFSLDNPHQAIYRIRVHTLGDKNDLYNNDKKSEVNIPGNNFNKAYIFYTIQELANTKDLPPVTVDPKKKWSLWISGAFVGRNGSAGGFGLIPTKNKQYPAGLEIYVHDPDAIEWEDARHFEIRFGDGDPRPLFTNSYQFEGFKAGLKGNVSSVGNFIYLFNSDKEDQFRVSFPGNLLSSRSLIYNLKPGKDEYAYIAGKVSIILYYKGQIVDSIGDGIYPLNSSGYFLGETLSGETPRFPNPLEDKRNCVFEWGGWLKRRPGTSPHSVNGLFEPSHWYHPKDQVNENYRPWKYNAKDNTENYFPFPVGNRSSSGKAGTHWEGDTCPGYTYP